MYDYLDDLLYYGDKWRFSPIQLEVLRFLCVHITLRQARQIKKIKDDDEQLLIYVISAYNVFDIEKNGGMRMITNPEALFFDGIETSAFMEVLKRYAHDMITQKTVEPIEVQTDVRTADNKTNRKDT